jgi:lipopolysaccharide/colanic/teichoic acid biosynthesis glycosyltransferase
MRLTRRIIDVTLASTALTVLALPLAVCAAVVKLTSRGPVFYRQQRIGRNGRPFCLYKFRTMRDGAGGGQVTVAGDARVTGAGRIMRRLKLDELPQLFNVVAGDMAIIGPRPEVERFVRQYTSEQRQILAFTPGLASMAQLVYPHESDLLRHAVDPEQVYVAELVPKKVAVDLAYEQRRTLWTDLLLAAEIALLVAGRSYRIDRQLSLRGVADPAHASSRQ